ncbi:hypothetical protein NKG05_25615 [Oerskovia sp. M15]
MSRRPPDACGVLRRRRGRRPRRPAQPQRPDRALDTGANTFLVVHPVDDELDWSIAVSKNVSAFGGFEIDRTDPATSEQTITTAADPTRSPTTSWPGSTSADSIRNTP